MYKKLSGLGLSDIQIKNVIKLYNERDILKKAEDALLEDIKNMGAKNANIVKMLLAKDELKLENGKIIGFEKQIENMKKNKETSFLFEEENLEENLKETLEETKEEKATLLGVEPATGDFEQNSDFTYESLCEIL